MSDPKNMYSGAEYPMQPTYGPGSGAGIPPPPPSEYAMGAPGGPAPAMQESRGLLHSLGGGGHHDGPNKHQISIVRKIRIVRLVFKTIAALLSLITSGLDINVYVNYWNSRDVVGRWPDNPFTAPTLLVIGVALIALLFDVCLLLAHLLRAKWAVVVATGAIWVLGFCKIAAFLVTAISIRSEYNYGINVGVTKDLWSYTCSQEQSSRYRYYDQAYTSCQMQNWVWYLTIVNICVEVIGFIVDKVMLIKLGGSIAKHVLKTVLGRGRH